MSEHFTTLAQLKKGDVLLHFEHGSGYVRAASETQVEVSGYKATTRATIFLNPDKREVEEIGLHLYRLLTHDEVHSRNLYRELLHSRFDSEFLYAASIAKEKKIPEELYRKESISYVNKCFEKWSSKPLGKKQKSLDDEQLAAVAAVNGHVQVVARAGSGKTTTLVNRSLFLLKHCGVAPSQMLLLAFNRKAVLEIRRRLLGLLNDGAEDAVAEEIARRRRAAAQKDRSVPNDAEAAAIDAIAEKMNIALPHVMTFHALAYSLVHPEESILYNGAEGEAQGLSRVFQSVIDDHLQLPEFHRQIRELMLAHFREDWERIVSGGYHQTKDEILKFRRSLPRESLGGDYVKSYGEKVIADFLFEHDIPYKYERNHYWSGVNYRPDFTIFKVSKRGSESGVIIEYFGLAGDADYDEMSVAKRKYWAAKEKWSLVEFTPVDISVNGDQAFRLQLQAHLEKLDIQCVRLSEDEIWHRLRNRAIDRFTKSVVGFIGPVVIPCGT